MSWKHSTLQRCLLCWNQNWLKKKKSRNEKRHLILGQCLVRLVSFMHDNSEDRLLLVLVPLLPTPGDGVTWRSCSEALAATGPRKQKALEDKRPNLNTCGITRNMVTQMISEFVCFWICLAGAREKGSLVALFLYLPSWLHNGLCWALSHVVLFTWNTKHAPWHPHSIIHHDSIPDQTELGYPTK